MYIYIYREREREREREVTAYNRGVQDEASALVEDTEGSLGETKSWGREREAVSHYKMEELRAWFQNGKWDSNKIGKAVQVRVETLLHCQNKYR